jgi:hypothetical protein
MAVGTLARVLTHPPEIKKDSLSKSFVITRATNKVAERAGFEPANAFTRYSISNRAPSAILSHLSTSIQLSILCKLAERVRFELTRRGLAAYSISSRAPSTNSAISPQTREK